MKIVFCGFGRAGLECFYQLTIHYEINNDDIIVFTHDADGNKDFEKHLSNNGIKYFYDKINDCHDELITFSPDYLISVYYRYIINKNILDVVGYKAMNCHPSLLPLYRGTKSSVWAILNNERETGITYHYINEKIDDGNILLQVKLKINKTDTAYSLYHKLISLFSLNFSKALDKLIENYPGYMQVGISTYYKRELPYQGVRSFQDTTYQEAILFLRAMYYPPFKGAIFRQKNGDEIEITDLAELMIYKNNFRK